ncbi:hypothetical protein LXG23DRAFT_36340 [Yarrowia lipolytica]|uniref:F-box domain-containing protein n=1 Tax=Yarrowia lipolytica TaxID=4952 RepID=A0A1D8NF45_YARLL|nr:hypothetical protein YALI1_D22888g [Yarrowia lipolytica]KAB8281179.1 hypothetical protein BKA91DRAFT_140657 [Yarrowia lipolytica]KAE8170721.1 hypothetical protein BKA90DRAFT_101340 [Yarrowia lipolytica]KAJ8054237.1 hypothetical protein LXG23DRAFT_36340 [Yarrowia lipolytica]RMI97221.1 hypothetical protein BD777DRAFT_126903 [Yarrowia lipolytica]
MDNLPTPILTRIISETDYDTAVALCHTSPRLSQLIRSPNNDTAIFKNIALQTFPWCHPAVGQSWRDLAWDVENIGPESDAEIWKETAQWTLADPDTDLGLLIMSEHPAAKEIAKDHVTSHIDSRVPRDTDIWGSGIVELEGGLVVDFVEAKAWKGESIEAKESHGAEDAEEALKEQPIARDIARDSPKLEKKGDKWIINGFSIPVTTGFIPTVHTHNNQTFVFETTVDVSCPDTAMSNLHVIDWDARRYIFLLSLIHEAGVFPVPYLSNGFLWLFYEHFVVKFNVDEIKFDPTKDKCTSKIFYVSQCGLPVSLRDCNFQVQVLWGRFAKMGRFFLDLETLMWFKIDHGLVHGMLHKTHHLWDYSKEALERIAEVVKDSEAVDAVSAVDISSCLKTKKKKKSKKKGRDTSTEADEVEKAMAGLDVNKDLPPELQID